MIPPAAAMWLSLIMTMSKRPMRWLAPPPAATAHLSSRRNPGAVLRVSSSTARVPAASAAMAAVAVAIPPARCIKFSATRSAANSARAGPWALPRRAPRSTRCPSVTRQVSAMVGSTRAKTVPATHSPATTPAALAVNSAVAWVSAGILQGGVGGVMEVRAE